MRAKTLPNAKAVSAKTILRFEVSLLSGPVTQSFVDKNPEPPSRTIDIYDSHTLEDLHEVIFSAFDRDEPHMYEFQLGGKKPMDRKAICYGMTSEDDFFLDYGNAPKSALITTLAQLNLRTGSVFWYWFDFGDDWWHKIRLVAVNPPEKGKGRYPRIVEKKGDSPPQYPDWEQDEEMGEFNAPKPANKSSAEVTASPDKEQLSAISVLIHDFCKSRLTEGYATVCIELLTAAHRTWKPLARGKAQGWAAGVVHAAGMINFLHDPATEPHMKLSEIATHFGVSPATMGTKSREIRDAVNAFPLDPRFCLPERLVNNPLIWLKEANGILVDMRTQPRAVQEAALNAGQIPFIPDPPAKQPVKKKPVKKKKAAKNKPQKSAQKETDKNNTPNTQYSLFT